MDDYLNKSVSSTGSQTFEYLRTHFQEVAQGKCQLWVNPANTDPFANVPLVEKYHIRISIRHPRFDMRLAPYLVALDLSQSIEAEVFEESVDIAWQAWTKESLSAFCGQPIAGWIATQAPAKALAAHWAQKCYLHRRQQLTKLLRFHDPGVREWLWPTLNDQQRDALLGPAESIVAIGRGHQLQRLTRSSGPASATVFPALALEDAQWSQVEDYASVHAAWVAACNESKTTKSYAPGWARDILKALGQATRYGVHDKQDRELFALHALQLGSDFHTEERMQPVWDRTRVGDYYSTAIEDVLARQTSTFT